MLDNLENYGVYSELVQNRKIIINTKDINIDNWDNHFASILNIFKDGIETDFVQSLFITVDFNGVIQVDLSITDYFFNLIMWYLIIRTGDPIEPKHLLFEKELTGRVIKKYIDNHFISINRKRFTNKELNNIIDDTLHAYSHINQFAFYLANTINLEDTLDLMKADPEVYDVLHADLSNLPLEDVKTIGNEYNSILIDKIKNSKSILGYDHCLADSFRAHEGINEKQHREFAINIGSKPDGRGGVFPEIINRSFINGGVSDVTSNFIESHASRTAQILGKTNVGTSGSFARLLGLNNMDSFLHQDPDYVCDTKAFEEIYIKSKPILHMLNNRYCRIHPNGVDFLIDENKHEYLIGKKIYLRSPMTCASKSRGEGICYKCYGDLAYTVSDINIGRIASELLSSELTQRLLSAKHLLETIIKKLRWLAEFFSYFEIDGNIIRLISDADFKGYKMIIDTESIVSESEDGYDDEDSDTQSALHSVYHEHISEFMIEDPDGERHVIRTEDYDNLYLSSDLYDIIKKKINAIEGEISINMNTLTDMGLFFIIIHNNELTKSLDRIKDIINKNDITKSMDKNSLLQALLETVAESNLGVSAIHLEVILSNQLRHVNDILELPEWQYPNEPYRILTLNDALTDNPSITISLEYQKIAKALITPLSFRKRKASFMDLFFMVRPQAYINSDKVIEGVKETDKDDDIITPAKFTRRAEESDED